MASLRKDNDIEASQEPLEEEAQECVLSLLALKTPESPEEANTAELPASEEPSPFPVSPNPLMMNVNDTMSVTEPSLPVFPAQSPLILPSAPLFALPLFATSEYTSEPVDAKNHMTSFRLKKRKRGKLARRPPVPILPYGWVEGGDSNDSVLASPLMEGFPPMDMETVLGGSKLVLPQDRGLVPDSLFVAMAQMKPSRVTIDDQIGSYRKRQLGFVGMCCKHCGGQPGYGRYFPDKPRSLAQTTTSQTILKHIDSKCRYCPAHIREKVKELEKVHHESEIKNAKYRPRYGARKVFFERVWNRLHKLPFPEEEEDEEASVEQSEMPPALDTEEEEDEEHKQYRSDMLPTKKKLKRRMMGE